MAHLTRIDLPACDYDTALDLQRRYVHQVQDDPDQAYLILTEHVPPVITLGRQGQADDILLSDVELAERGIEVRRCRRGGQVTWHGPGQLTAYAIVCVGRSRRSVHAHVRHLEQAALDTLETFGICGQRRDDGAGVWVGRAKIASVGVAVERWVCYHGAAINVCNDLAAFEAIVPCGRRGERVTSIREVLGHDVRVDAVADVFARIFRDAAGLADAPLIADDGGGP